MDCPKCHAPNPDTQSFCGQCGFSLQPAASASDAVTAPSLQPRDELETGTTFAGRYQIIEELGHGGMGRVYKVIDKEVGAKIALKLIRPEIASDRATIDRFRQELKTAREISHKNICRMYDLGRDGTTYFLTMEYVPGQDLKSMIAMSGQLGIGTAISIAKQVCDGLAEAHRLGIVHRDLKPQNIQIDKGGHARIMDFGIARSAMMKGVTDAGVVIGTPQYMSPEQVEAKDVDARADIYSLGIILYEMLTGRVPFDGDTPLSVAVKQKLERPRDPRELNPGIPPDLDHVILKCLEKDKSLRYQSAAEVQADLARIEQGLPTTEQVVPQLRPSTSKEITVHFTMRQLLVPALVAIALLVVAIAAWWLLPRRASVVTPPTGKPTLAVLYFENISGDPSLNTWRTGLPELLITGLSQSRVMNVVSSERVFSILKKLNLADAKRYSAEDLTGVAREGNAQYLLTGSVMRAGQSTVITTRLQKAATGEVIRSEKLECLTEQEILSKVDGLTKNIKTDLNLSPQEVAGDPQEALGQIITSSPEALKYYTEARRYHVNLANEEAIRLYERAVEVDPGFAMAYRGLSACYGNIGENAKSADAGRKALERTDRLPERLRYHVQITAYLASDATYPQVIDVCKKLLAKYPDDTLGLNYLANVYDDMEEFEKALELREADVRVTPSFLDVNNLAATYAQSGKYDKAFSLLASFLEREPANARAHLSNGWGYMLTGQFDSAQREAEKAVLLAPREMDVVFLKGRIAYLRGDFPTSEREWRSVLEQGTETERWDAHDALANLYLTLGRFERARAESRAAQPGGRSGGFIELASGHPDRAIPAFQAVLADSRRVVEGGAALRYATLLGLSYVALGDFGGAQRVAAGFKTRGGGLFVKPATRLGLVLSGAVALKRGDGRSAAADLERAVTMLPYQVWVNDEHAVVLDLLGQAYTVVGDLVKSRETYEKITTLTSGRLQWGAIYSRSFYHLGQIAERQGDSARAQAQYLRFLEICKEAAPGLPEVADARKWLAR